MNPLTQFKELRILRFPIAAALMAIVVVALMSPNLALAIQRVVIHVDDDAAPGGDGSPRFPFNNIADAFALAGSFGGAVVVVEPGQYPVSSTLRIQSSIELRGSNVMQVDDAGWPTGSIAPGTETRIVGTAALGTSDLVSVAPSGNGIVQGVEIRNLTFDSGPARGNDLSFNRTQDYSVRESVFTGGHSGTYFLHRMGYFPWPRQALSWATTFRLP